MANNSILKKGRCVNFGNCDKADAKESIEVSLGEKFICPSCGGTLMEERKETPPKWLIPVVVALVIGGGVTGGYFYATKRAGGDKDPDTIIHTKKPPVVTTDTIIQVEPPVEPPVDPPTPDPNVVITQDLGYAVWVGRMKNGKFNDSQGELTYKSRHLIEERDGKKRVANPGDRVVGTFINGHATNVRWYKADGNVETIFIGEGGND